MQFNLKGIVRSGGTAQPGAPENPMSPTYMPLANAQVRLFDAGLSAPVDQGVTDANGAFHLQAFHYGANSIYYVTASVSEEVVLMAVIGQALFVDDIVVNELTTVAAVYSLAQFFNEQQVIEGPAFGLRVAALMNTNIVQVRTGDSSNVLTAAPNGNQTNAWRLTLSLANLLVTCVRDPQTAGLALFNLTTPPGGTRPANTIAAMLNIVRYPANQVQWIYDQAHAAGVYQPPLENVPDAWTLAVKVNDSGNNDMMFAGPGNVAFDRYGRAWIPNNVVQGQPYSCTWAMLLDPAGRPAVGEDKKLLSPITGGGIIGGGFGVAIDANEHVWLGNFGWGGEDYYPAECVSELNLDTTAVSPAGTGGADRVQGTVVDPLSGNVWFAGFGTHTVFVYIGGSPDSVARYQPNDDTFDPFGIAIAADGTAWVTSTNSQSPQIVHLQLDTANNVITAIGEPIRVGAQNKGVVVDSGGNVWFAAASDDPAKDCIYFFGADGTRKTFQDGGMHGPWGITLDGGDNLWVGNFGSMIPENVFEGRLTRLASATVSNPTSNPGQPLTPSTGYTLPTAGEPVTLANGDPLYGPGTPPCLIPMMRTTGVQVDAAGNVWTCNNWKPNFTDDYKGGNPGGDGIVIFVGVATPVIPRGA